MPNRYCYDVETYLSRPGCMAPMPVCAGAVVRDLAGATQPRGKGKFLLRGEVAEWLAATLTHCIATGDKLTNAFVAYDNAVMIAHHPELIPLVFEAYSRHLIGDCIELAKMHDFATRGRLHPNLKMYSLAGLSAPLGYALDKDTHRLSYGEYDQITDVRDWPAGAVEYATTDAEAADDVWQFYEKKLLDLGMPHVVAGCYEQSTASFLLYLMTCQGVRVDGDLLERHLAAPLAVKADVARDLLYSAGVLTKEIKCPKTAPKWTGKYIMRDAAVQDHLLRVELLTGRKLPRTPKRGTIATGADELGPALTGVVDPVAKAIVFYSGLGSQMGLIERLREAAAGRAHFRFTTSVETCRTASGGGTLKYNSQNTRKRWGWRQIFIPDDPQTQVFASIDYPQIELRALAQTCLDLFGASQLGEALNAGLDPHLVTAASFLELDVDEAARRYAAKDPAVDDMRQLAKAFNFGLPGGLGETTFIEWARLSYGKAIPSTSGAFSPAPGLAEVGISSLLEHGFKTIRANGFADWSSMPDEVLLRVDSDPPGEMRIKLWTLAAYLRQSSIYLADQCYGYLAYRWYVAFPEVAKYQAWVKDRVKRHGGLITIPRTGWTIANRTYTNGCNVGFQSPVASGMKRGAWYVARAAMADPESPVYGCELWNTVHDELLLRAGLDWYQPAFEEAAALFARGMDEVCPDYPCASGTVPAAMRRWDKSAETHYEDGKLIPWEDVILATYPDKINALRSSLANLENVPLEKARKYLANLEFSLSETEEYFRRFSIAPML